MPTTARAQDIQITEVQPGHLIAGQGDVMITLHGSGFNASSRISFNSTNIVAASVTPTSVSFALPAKYYSTDWIGLRRFRDGEARLVVKVINGPAADDPSGRIVMSVFQPGHGPSAPVRPKPLLSGVSPLPAAPEGMLSIHGDHFDTPSFGIVLIPRDPNARVSSYSRDRYVTARSKTRVDFSLAGVPPGNYTLQIEGMDENGKTLARFDVAVAIGAPPAALPAPPRPDPPVQAPVPVLPPIARGCVPSRVNPRSAQPGGERCFGAIGNACETQLVTRDLPNANVYTRAAVLKNCSVRVAVSVGSILHDNCCRAHPDGLHCQGANAWTLATDFTQCARL